MPSGKRVNRENVKRYSATNLRRTAVVNRTTADVLGVLRSLDGQTRAPRYSGTYRPRRKPSLQLLRSTANTDRPFRSEFDLDSLGRRTWRAAIPRKKFLRIEPKTKHTSRSTGFCTILQVNATWGLPKTWWKSLYTAEVVQKVTFPHR